MVLRKFFPGNEWTYLKIYSGIKTADVILQEAITPLIYNLKEKNFINCWFFIRYNDPRPHLRLRLKLTDTQNYNEILYSINTVFQQYISSGEISSILLDTYNQEIERYGVNTIDFAESLFCKSSDLILNFLEYDDEEKIIVSLFYIDCMLSELKLSQSEKLKWISPFNASFKEEFNGDKSLNRQLDRKYRVFKSKYLDFTKSEDYIEIRNLILSNIQGTLTTENIDEIFPKGSVSNFFQSIFHMHINRLFTSNQRLFEMILYDYLYRHYKTMVAIKI